MNGVRLKNFLSDLSFICPPGLNYLHYYRHFQTYTLGADNFLDQINNSSALKDECSDVDTFHANLENLVFWARSDNIGCAVCLCHGMMENWNVGTMGGAECDLFLNGWRGSKIKIRPSSSFDTQCSIFPSFQYSNGERSELSSC
jgi:hypothetical protein